VTDRRVGASSLPRTLPSWRDGAAREAVLQFLDDAGTLEAQESIPDQAGRLGRVTVSMRDDWSTVFGE
jgi:hypothetical protein